MVLALPVGSALDRVWYCSPLLHSFARNDYRLGLYEYERKYTRLVKGFTLRLFGVMPLVRWRSAKCIDLDLGQHAP